MADKAIWPEKMTATCTIGIVTSKNHAHCRDVLIRFLESLTYDPINYIFATDDVEALKTVIAPIEKRGLVKVISGGLAEVRDEYLKQSDELLFVIDGDVIGPKNIIEALNRHQKPLVCGVVLGAYKDKQEKVNVLPAAFVPDQPGTSKQLSIPEIIKPRLIKLSIGTASCLFARRAALEKAAFAPPPEGAGDAVTGFFLAAQQAGNEAYLDTLVKCARLPFPLTDQRNKQFDARNYQIKVKAKLPDKKE